MVKLRIASIDSVREGDLLGKAIFSDDGKVLLSSGVKLTGALISRLKSLGIQALYIEDHISEGIVIDDVISVKTRIEAKKIVKNIFEKKAMDLDTQYGKVSSIVNDIVDDVLNNRNSLINLIDIKTKDDYTFSHSVNVAVIATMMGVHLGYSIDKLRKLCLGGLLHDIGKVYVPKEIINKPGKLTPAEFEEIKKHPQYGYAMVKDCIEYCPITKAIILTHHEKSNGSGYPMGLTYDKIHECSRIASIADIYDAMTSDRVYRRRINPSEVVEYIVAMTYEWFDLRTVESFRRCIAPYPLGTYVRLSTGDIAIVSGINNIMPTRPQVRIVEPCRGQMYRNVTIDLMRELSINIVDTEA